MWTDLIWDIYYKIVLALVSVTVLKHNRQEKNVLDDTHRHKNIYPYGIFIRYIHVQYCSVLFLLPVLLPLCLISAITVGDTPLHQHLLSIALTLISLSSFAHLWESGGDNALSCHGNWALMWSWPDVPIAITL